MDQGDTDTVPLLQMIGAMEAKVLVARRPAPDWEKLALDARRVSEAEIQALADRFTEETVKGLRDYSSTVSPQHRQGIEAATRFAAEQVYGVAEPVMAVSSMSTGMGKSEIAAAIGRVLTSDAELAGIGLVIFTNTLRELPTLAERMGFSLTRYDPRFAVFTGNKNEKLNALGRGIEHRGEAQVLLTTQSKFLWWHRFRPYRRGDFYYRGEERQIRLWDETALPIDPMTMTPDQLEDFAGELFQRGDYEVARQVIEWARELRQLPHNTLVKVPAFRGAPVLLPYVDFETGEEGEAEVKPRLLPCDESGAIGKDEDDETIYSEMCAALAYLSEKEVRIYQDAHTGAAISYREILPDSITPLLVFDANADKRTAYKLMEKGRGGVVHLYSPRKTYRGFTVKHRHMAAGRRQHHQADTRKPLVDAAADAFFEAQEAGPQPVLLLHYMATWGARRIPDMLRAVKREIKKRGGNPSLLVGIHWGMEKATNKFREVRAVIALGVQQAPLYAIVAEVRGLLRLRNKADVDAATIEAHRRAQQMTTLFQGVGRSAIRTITEDGDVPPVTLWLIVSTMRGKMPFPLELLPEWFPEMPPVQEWGPPRVAGGQRAAFLEALKAWPLGEPFGYRSFEPALTRKVVRNYLNDGSMVKPLAAAGLVLQQTARGGTKKAQFRLISGP